MAMHVEKKPLTLFFITEFYNFLDEFLHHFFTESTFKFVPMTVTPQCVLTPQILPFRSANVSAF